MAAAAISEGAPPSSWQKGDTPIPALGLGCVRRGSIPAGKQHCNCLSLSLLQSVVRCLKSLGHTCQLPVAPLLSPSQVSG